MRTLPIALAALALTACGDPLVFAEIEEQEICFSKSTGTIPGVPAIVGPGTVHVPPGTIDVASGIPGLDGKDTTGTIKMTSLTFTTSGVDVSGIQAVHITLTHDADAPVNVDYDRPADGPVDPSRIATTFVSPELLPWILNGGTVGYDVTLSGTLPTSAWSATLDACFSAKVKVDLLQAAKN